MILLVIFVVALFLWFLTLLPAVQPHAPGAASGWLAFICVLLLGVIVLHAGRAAFP